MSRTKPIDRRSISTRGQALTNLAASAAAGSLVGIAAGLLLAPQSGRRLRKKILRNFEELGDKGQDFAEDMMETGHKAVCSATDYAENLKGSARHLLKKMSHAETENTSLGNILLGAIGGGVLGAASAYLLASAEEEEAIHNKNNWFDAAKEIVETVKDKVCSANGSEVEEKEEDSQHLSLHDVLEYASLGMRLWQNFKKKR